MDLLHKLQMSECLNMFLNFLRGVVSQAKCHIPCSRAIRGIQFHKPFYYI